MRDTYIPYGAYWSTPFVRWQGSFSHLHPLEFAANRLAVGQIQGDALHLRLMDDLRADHPQHHRIALRDARDCASRHWRIGPGDFRRGHELPRARPAPPPTEKRDNAGLNRFVSCGPKSLTSKP